MFLKKFNFGFTLMEMLIVVTIIGILSAIVVPRLQSNVNDARESRFDAERARINTQLELFNFLNGYYPIQMSNEHWSNPESGCMCQYTYFFPEGVPTGSVYGTPWNYDNILGRITEEDN
ncbi:hypothetical protein CL647_04525 [bacterium]|nr:hypothetical protein [Actinomycetota bacterium]MBE33366.1 hypothetical protein [bacterium]|tara:strand:+ start:13771 stop:14127 length:357 start_codon:yes stop_codon:yes gene_type:complete